jgi:hypothetical protein
MDWQGFLEDFCDRVLRLEAERDVFLAMLSDANIGKSQQQIATTLNITKETLKKYMNAVYAAAGREFALVAKIEGRGKLKELRGCLKECYRLQAPQPPILGEPSQEVVVKSGLKVGVPMPIVRLPENFVARPEALAAVKGMLLEESERALVVSAIAGLGALGSRCWRRRSCWMRRCRSGLRMGFCG